MKDTEIRKYAELMKELGLTGLEITEDTKKVRLERSFGEGMRENVSVVPTLAAAPSVTSSQQKELTQATDYISVKSPIVGVFYAAPAENANPYVAAGDRVKKGQTLCIVEAMKLMNEITAEEDGVISEVCATNGQIVEYSTELFRITR